MPKWSLKDELVPRFCAAVWWPGAAEVVEPARGLVTGARHAES